MSYTIHTLPIFHVEMNYTYAITHDTSGKTYIVDVADPDPVLDFLGDGKTLDTILVTHHHWDHTDGVASLVERTGAKVLGNMLDSHRLPSLDVAVVPEQDVCLNDNLPMHVLAGDGHTMGHIMFYFPTLKSVFVGDVLFTLGCGRMFEGTPEVFFESIQRIKSLPADTWIYGGHEYTASSLRFVKHVCDRIGKTDLDTTYIRHLRTRVLNKHFTSPALLADERKNNPFMWAETVEEFHMYRQWRNVY